MTAHTCRLKRPARGTETGNFRRIMVSLEPDEMRRLCWLARKHKIPVAKVLRNAVWAYLLPIAATADADAAKEGTQP